MERSGTFQEVSGVVEISNKNRPERDLSKAEKVGDVEIVGPTANVGLSVTYTKNLGNFESAKISISLHYPVSVKVNAPLNMAALDSRFKEIEAWVDQRMSDTVQGIGS